MDSRIRIIIGSFIAFILLVDGFAYLGMALDFSFMRQLPGILAFCIIPILIILRIILYGRKFSDRNITGFPKGFFVFTGLFLSVYVPKLLFIVFLFIENICIVLIYGLLKVISNPVNFSDYYHSSLLNNISLIIIPVSILTFLVILSGMLFGRFNFRLRNLETDFPDLPSEFDGFTIIHISDLHLGSINGHQDKIKKAIDIINGAEADLILFTGDLVNNLADETEGWTDLLSTMSARHGKYAITGNHDYGEFMEWPDEKSRQDNMKRLISAHETAGFKVLMNDSAKINLGKDDIFIVGVENWGLPPFQQYGDLGKAMKDLEEDDFRILMSHDPSHWDEEVVNKTGAQLTLSGHTHGFQFGIRTKRFKWSPVQYKYPRWIGIYQQGYQFLHVSPGLGYIGYAGRIGIPPEITVITLRKSTK
jgi:uncharacterized protein